MKIAQRFSAGYAFRSGRESVKRTTDKPKIPLDFRSAVRFTDSLITTSLDPTDKIGGLFSFVGFADFCSKAASGVLSATGVEVLQDRFGR